MKKILWTFLLCFVLASCEKAEEEKTPPPPEPAKKETVSEIKLIPADFQDLANWQTDDLAAAASGFALSCQRILNEKNPYLSNAEVKISTPVYQDICRRFTASIPMDTPAFRAFIEENFKPYLVTDNGNENGKFTSYFESSLRASRYKHDQYQYPVYGKPYDLIEFNARDFDPEAPNKRYVGRVVNQKLLPYFTREEIEKNPAVNAPVILWGDSNIDINIMQIQGSAVAKLDDGSEVRVGFADSNGHPFKGIGSILLAKGLLKPGEASMSHIKKWLIENPELAETNLYENKRFIFHRLIDADGPIGAHGVPLHAGRSLAVDRRYIPLGSLLWLETTGPDKENIQRLVVAQDIGSAIKGIVRGDYFWGSGADEILDKAGKMNSAGLYYILLPKTQETNNE